MRFTDQEEEVCGDETYTEILSGSQDAIGNDDEAANGNTGDQSADSTQDQASRYVPVFEPIDANEARARASTEQWRTFTVLLEPQPGSVEAASVCKELTQLVAEQGKDNSCGTRFTIITKDLLMEASKRRGFSGKSAPAQAFVSVMAEDRLEGLVMKKKRALRSKNEECRDDESDWNEGSAPSQHVNTWQRDHAVLEENPGSQKVSEDCGNKKPEASNYGGTDPVTARQRERAKLELRAARLLTTADDDLATLDRVYILEGFLTTDAEPVYFLGENHAFYTRPANKQKSEAQPSLELIDGKLVFFSALDAVIRLTTGELISTAAEASPRNESRSGSRSGTESSNGSTMTHQLSLPGRLNGRLWEIRRLTDSAYDKDCDHPCLGLLCVKPQVAGGEDNQNTTSQQKESAWNRSHVNSTFDQFTQASETIGGAFAVGQANNETVWQDVSFCDINIFAPKDSKKDTHKATRPGISTEILDEAPATSETTAESVGEIIDILEIEKGFKEIVTQMAFEKFDFHQWFSTAEVVALPHKDAGINLTLAAAEARAVTMGSTTSVDGWNGAGSAARVEGSVWVTNLALSTYCNLMLSMPDELTSVATTLYCMVEAVMLECVGVQPHPLKVFPPPLLKASNGSNKPFSASRVSEEHPIALRAANGHLGQPSSFEAVSSCAEETNSRRKEEWEDSQNVLSGATILVGTESSAPPLRRNTVLDFGDFAGERAIRGALNRAATPGEGRLDPRGVVGVERAAIDQLQHPRLVGQGGLPLEPKLSYQDRKTEQCELMNFTGLDRKDVDRARKVWALAQLVNKQYPRASGGEWNFDSRRYWEVLPRHVVPQVLMEENGTEPVCLRQYYPPTDELLIALHHHVPEGRARICSWDPSTSGSIPFKFRPSFKDWADITFPKDSSYTPRSLCAFGALMDVSKTDMDRAKTKSVNVFPADHSLVVLSGFVATGERWLSTFKDKHIMGLRLTEFDQQPSRTATPESKARIGKTDPVGVNSKFAAHFSMAFDDGSRLVVKENAASHATPTPSRPASSSPSSSSSFPPPGENIIQPTLQDISNLKHASGASGTVELAGHGTISCVHTFSTGLVVTATSDGTVSMKFMSDVKRGKDDKVLAGFLPEAAKDEISRAVVGRGTVVRYMRDGSTQKLFATGDVVTIRGDETTLTDKYGKLYRKTTAPSISDEWAIGDPNAPILEKTGDVKNAGYPLDASRDGISEGASRSPVRDVETGAVVWLPPDTNERAIVLCEDGLVVTRHADGTVQRWCKRESEGGSATEVVLVECAGFASVEIDVEIQETCSRHARGQPVAFTSGGNKTRLRAAMPNGGAMMVTYDTRVTSQVRGRVIYVHIDNTEVIANDRGEVVVRPRGLWEGRPVHDILAGPKLSMPPNRAQPDLLVGAYIFDCFKGVMETEDVDRNLFILDVTKTAFLEEDFTLSRAGGSLATAAVRRPLSRNEGERSDGITIDLAGETCGVRSDALVTNPMEPRLFVYRRDGSALELLRNEDVQAWYKDRLLFSSDSSQHNLEREYGGNVDDVVAPYLKEDKCCADLHVGRGCQLSFYLPLTPTLRGEGSFAALLQRRSGTIFGCGYDYEDNQNNPALSWRTRPLPSAARASLSSEARKLNCSSTTAMEVFVRRVWLKHPPFSVDAAENLRNALEQWEAWRRKRVEQIDRFTVTDLRPLSEVQAQHAVQKIVKKAFRKAKAARKKEMEKVTTASAQAAALKAGETETGVTPKICFGEISTTVTATRGQDGYPVTSTGTNVHGEEEWDDEFDAGVGSSDSSEEENNQEMALLREEVASAYASAGGEICGYLSIPSLRLAMVTVLGRSVRENEAESCLFAARKRTFPGQPKASLQDLLQIVQEYQESQPTSNRVLSSASDDQPVNDLQIPHDVDGNDDDHLSSGPRDRDAVYASLSPNPNIPVTRLLHLKSLPPPRGFWGTFIGRTLDDTNVRRTSCNDATADDSQGSALRGESAQGTGSQTVKSLSRGGRGGEEEEERREESRISHKDRLEESDTPHRDAVLIGEGKISLPAREPRSVVFQITPSSVSLGSIVVGRTYPLKIMVVNVSYWPARFRVDHQLSADNDGEMFIEVNDYPRGMIAAGLAVELRLNVSATRTGAMRQLVRIVAEDGVAEVMITGKGIGASKAAPESVNSW